MIKEINRREQEWGRKKKYYIPQQRLPRVKLHNLDTTTQFITGAKQGGKEYLIPRICLLPLRFEGRQGDVNSTAGVVTTVGVMPLQNILYLAAFLPAWWMAPLKGLFPRSLPRPAYTGMTSLNKLTALRVWKSDLTSLNTVLCCSWVLSALGQIPL